MNQEAEVLNIIHRQGNTNDRRLCENMFDLPGSSGNKNPSDDKLLFALIKLKTINKQVSMILYTYDLYI